MTLSYIANLMPK